MSWEVGQAEEMAAKDVHALTPGTCECVVTWHRGTRVPNQLTRRQGDYPELSGGAQCNPQCP